MTGFQKLWTELERLRALLDRARDQAPTLMTNVHPELVSSARNFIDYLALRQVDLRPLQFELERRGLSSLGRMEGHVHDALDQVRARLGQPALRRATQRSRCRGAQPARQRHHPR